MTSVQRITCILLFFFNVDGNIFIFANNRAILLDYTKNKVVKYYPTILGGEPINYRSTGFAVLLPLTNLQKPEAEVVQCILRHKVKFK